MRRCGMGLILAGVAGLGEGGSVAAVTVADAQAWRTSLDASRMRRSLEAGQGRPRSA
jgi:hypothetical protein